jgi:hypothetical protein
VSVQSGAPPVERGKGWHRDVNPTAPGFGAFRAQLDAKAPPRDMVREIDRLRDQTITNGCVGFAFSRAINIRARLMGIKAPYPSAQAIYTVARMKSGARALVDQGCMPADAAEGLQGFGVVDEARWPFDEAKINDVLPWDVLQAGADAQVAGCFRIDAFGQARTDQVRTALAARLPRGVRHVRRPGLRGLARRRALRRPARPLARRAHAVSSLRPRPEQGGAIPRGELVGRLGRGRVHRAHHGGLPRLIARQRPLHHHARAEGYPLMRSLALIVLATLAACAAAPPRNAPSDAPPPVTPLEPYGGPDGAAGSTCERACARLAALGCPESKPNHSGDACPTICERVTALEHERAPTSCGPQVRHRRGRARMRRALPRVIA